MSLFEQEAPAVAKRPGPPNRMNDLPYREWMKFQKSFFRLTSDEELARQHLEFFTKAVWPDGQASVSLVTGHIAEAVDDHSARVIDLKSDLSTLDSLVDHIEQGPQLDFALIDLRHCAAADLLTESPDPPLTRLFQALSLRLKATRYCTLLVYHPAGAALPAPWFVASQGRQYLRLRDEKVGLAGEQERTLYCLNFQKELDDAPIGPKPSEIMIAAHCEAPSYTIPRSPPRDRQEILHPAKYPETLIQEFVEFFTKPNDWVFDPMVGTGSTVIAALRSDRNGMGVELNPEFADIARQRVARESQPGLFHHEGSKEGVIVTGDATKIRSLPEFCSQTFDYAVTSPPYWSMLQNPGSENQKARREKNLALVYSDSDKDLGNVTSYGEFVPILVEIYESIASRMEIGAVLTIIVKNVKREHIIYPLAWDLVFALCKNGGCFSYAGTTLWCQDDIGLKPFAVGIHWVSNTLHNYCVHLRVERHSHTKPSAA